MTARVWHVRNKFPPSRFKLVPSQQKRKNAIFPWFLQGFEKRRLHCVFAKMYLPFPWKPRFSCRGKFVCGDSWNDRPLETSPNNLSKISICEEYARENVTDLGQIGSSNLNVRQIFNPFLHLRASMIPRNPWIDLFKQRRFKFTLLRCTMFVRSKYFAQIIFTINTVWLSNEVSFSLSY